MAGGNATLVAWSLVGDLPWMTTTPRGFKQKSVPKPGEPVTWFQKELARIKAHIAEQNLKIVRTPADVDLALKGDPHVVLAVEGATFLDDDIAQLQVAYDLGIRHIQLVHYIRNAIGDFQTERPQHSGLTELGKKVVQECNRLGILVDLAHGTARCGDAGAGHLQGADGVVAQLRDAGPRKPQWTMPVVQARQLSLEGAKAIAAKGGVVGLWAPALRRGPDAGGLRRQAVGDGRLAGRGPRRLRHRHERADRPAHRPATPTCAASSPTGSGGTMSEARIRKLAIENYARVLRQAFAARQA